MEAKPGYRTTEFYLTIIATLVGFALASGAFADGSVYAQIFGFIGMVLSTMGYTVSRGITKSK